MKSDKNIVWENFRPVVNSAVPIYRQLAEALRGGIVRGELATEMKLPSEAELAGLLSVNHLTLRKSLRILAEQKLILQRQGRGTFVNAVEPIRFRVGVVLSMARYFHDAYYLQSLAAIMAELQECGGGEVLLLDGEETSSDVFLREINRGGCNALIVLNCGRKLLEHFSLPAFDFLPMVFVNHPGPCAGGKPRYRVMLQDGAITRGLDYLTGLGHRRILYISIENPFNPSIEQRNREFLNYPLPEKMAEILPFRSQWYEVGRMVARRCCSGGNPPGAIITPGIHFAFGAWTGVLEAGLKIPEDISFFGIDGNPHFNPQMTTLDQPLPAMMHKALELLNDMRGVGKHLKQLEYRFEGILQERGSCRTQ